MIMDWLYRRTLGRLNDLNALVSLHFTLIRLGWSPPAFFTDGAAANPTLQLMLLKALLFTAPQSILELGSGQSTKILSCYHRDNPGSYILTLEEDEGFAKVMRPLVSHDYRHVSFSRWYDVELTRQFDLILVDGPSDVPKRMGLLDHLPRILAPSFILVIDDTDQRATVPMVRSCGRLLPPHISFRVRGWKEQTVFCSPDHRFLACS